MKLAMPEQHFEHLYSNIFSTHVALIIKTFKFLDNFKFGLKKVNSGVRSSKMAKNLSATFLVL